MCLCFSGLAREPLCFSTVHEEHLGAVALTGSTRGVHNHQLASYFLVRSSTALRLLSGKHRCLVFSGLIIYVEDVCLVALSDPPQTLNPKTLHLPLRP